MGSYFSVTAISSLGITYKIGLLALLPDHIDLGLAQLCTYLIETDLRRTKHFTNILLGLET